MVIRIDEAKVKKIRKRLLFRVLVLSIFAAQKICCRKKRWN